MRYIIRCEAGCRKSAHGESRLYRLVLADSPAIVK